MLDPEGAQTLARYKAWADDLTLGAVAALPPGEAARERATLFKSIIGTLNHSYVVDLIWQAHLEGREHGFTARSVVPHPELEALAAAQRRANGWLLAWSEAQSPASLREAVSFRMVSGERGSMTRAGILLHIVNHATYHRGWVSDLFFQVPAKPPTTDWNVFLLRGSRNRGLSGLTERASARE
ncbi:MAG TPA: DinB family protein [Steroidobacteraceae bacterium]|nr:DinB family protein [Steroidobacteraceae bacterium]